MCVVVPGLEALQTSTDVSRRSVGSHSIEEAPGERGGFLTATWLSVVCSAKTPLAPLTPPPTHPLKPRASTKTTKVPLLAGSSLCPLLPSHNPLPLHHPASIRRRYSIHRRRALITKQDYGPCLGTTCQGACSLSRSLSAQLTHFRDEFVCVCVCVWVLFFVLFCFGVVFEKEVQV